METKYIVTLAVALGGWIFAAVMYWLSYRERQATRKEDQLFRTLTEAYWKDSPRSRTILIPLLGNQAIYLLAVSKQGTAHERNNLERIMGLITDYAPLKSKFSHLAKELAELTSPDSTRRGKTGNTVSDEKLTKWNKVLK
jgi:hypothetical protein